VNDILRPLETADAEELARLLSANRVFMAPYGPERPEGFFTVEAQRERLVAAEYLFGIFDEGALAGTIALSNLVRDVFQSASLGYWVDCERNGRGLATRGVGAIVEFAFAELGLHRLEAATLVDNIASIRVLEKNHFAHIGIAPHYLRIAGAWRDHLLFQRTVED
jgi:ribosomal-protein-alanine N-acetyltransferase